MICQVISPSQPTSLADFLCKAQACKHFSSFTNASIVYENKQIAQRQYTISQYLREKSLNISNKALRVHHDALSSTVRLYMGVLLFLTCIYQLRVQVPSLCMIALTMCTYRQLYRYVLPGVRSLIF